MFTDRQESFGTSGGPASTLETYSTIWILPSNVRLDTMSRAAPEQPSTTEQHRDLGSATHPAQRHRAPVVPCMRHAPAHSDPRRQPSPSRVTMPISKRHLIFQPRRFHTRCHVNVNVARVFCRTVGELVRRLRRNDHDRASGGDDRLIPDREG